MWFWIHLKKSTLKNLLIYYYTRCKERSVINGMTGRVHYCKGETIFIKSGTKIIPVFPVDRNQTPYYPVVAGYCFTIHKMMGQTLSHITLVFDNRHLAPAVGYVALSRVSDIDNVIPTIRVRKTHFVNY